MSKTNRSVRRTAIQSPGAIRLGMFRSVKCDILDVSQGGARLVLEAPAKLPDSFRLKSPDFKRPRACEVRWKRDLEVGVQFQNFDAE